MPLQARFGVSIVTENLTVESLPQGYTDYISAKKSTKKTNRETAFGGAHTSTTPHSNH